MELKDLTKEQLMLLNTQFPEEIEKRAQAEVKGELEKIAELEDVAISCLNYGSELAMQKIAEMEANYAEEKKEEEKPEEEEEEEEKEEEEEEKTASAMGKFILEGYWNTLMEKGAEFYGDENIYLEELCKEAGLDTVAKNIMTTAKKVLDKGARKAKQAYRKGSVKAKRAYRQNVPLKVRKHLEKYKTPYTVGGSAGAGIAADRAIRD